MPSPAAEEAISFLPLLLVAILAAAVPLLLGRFRQLRLPVVVGEIIAGLIVGKSGLGWVMEDPWLAFLSTLGFAYLMFLSGLEVDFEAIVVQIRNIRHGRWTQQPLILSGLFFLLSLGASVGVAFLLTWWGLISSPWLVALILDTISLGVVVPVLKERRLLQNPYGQALLLTATAADFVTMILISLYAAIVTRGLTFDILLVLILLGAFLTAFRLAVLLLRRVPRPLVRLEEWLAARTAQVSIRVAFALALGFIALAETLGIEVILGAFLGGAIVSLMAPHEGSDLREKLDALGYGFFIPVFFIHVGTQLDLRRLFASQQALALLPILVLAAFLVKIVPGLVFRLAYGWRQTWGAGVLLSAQLSLTIVAATIGEDLGLISSTVTIDLIVMAAVTCIVAPLLFERIVPRITAARRRGVVIVGADEIGLSLGQQLGTHEEPVTVVDVDAERCQKAERLGLPVLCGDARRPEILERAGLGQARVLVCVLRQVEQALEVCRLARRQFGPETIVAWIERPQDRAGFQELGVRTIVPSLATISVLENVVRYPDAFLFLSDLEESGERQVRELVLEQDCWDGQPLRAVPLHPEVLVLAIRRGDRFVVPRGSTKLQRGDILTLMGRPESLGEARQVCME